MELYLCQKLFCLFCLFAAITYIVQVYLLTVNYLKYETEIKVNNEHQNEFILPSITICVDIEHLLNMEFITAMSTNLDLPEKSSAKQIKSLIMKLTNYDKKLFTKSVLNQIHNCEILRPINFSNGNHNHNENDDWMNCTELLKTKEYFIDEQRCVTYFSNQVRLPIKINSGHRQYFLRMNLFRRVNYDYQIYLNSPREKPKMENGNWISLEILNMDLILRAREVFAISFQEWHQRSNLNSDLYGSKRCYNYNDFLFNIGSRDDCLQQCLIKSSEKQDFIPKEQFTDVLLQMKSYSLNILNRKLFNYCNEKCSLDDCEKYNYKITNVNAIKSNSFEGYGREVNWNLLFQRPAKTLLIYTKELKISPYQYILNIGSVTGLYSCFCFIIIIFLTLKNRHETHIIV